MRYVMPVADTELTISIRGANNVHLCEADRNIYIFVEEDDTEPAEWAILRFFDTGAAIEGRYLGTLGNGKAARHLYWVNAYEGAKYDPTSGHLRVSDEMPEVQTAGSDYPSSDASGQSEDI